MIDFDRPSMNTSTVLYNNSNNNDYVHLYLFVPAIPHTKFVFQNIEMQLVGIFVNIYLKWCNLISTILFFFY